MFLITYLFHRGNSFRLLFSSAHFNTFRIRNNVGKFEALLNISAGLIPLKSFWSKKRLALFPYIRGEELITKPQSVQCS